jgi:multiple sugar transport system substrate-binding protein
MRLDRRIGIVCLGFALASGCGPRDAPAPPAGPSLAGATLPVAVVAGANPEEARGLIAPLNAQRGEWEANTQAQVTLAATPLSGPEAARSADVLAFRADQLGDLIDAGALVEIPSRAVQPPDVPEGSSESGQPAIAPADPLAFGEILPAYRDQVARWGDDLMALPIGGSALVLIYRREAFERDENLQAAREAGLSLTPPKTYAELDALARFFQGRDWDGDGRSDQGIALALGEDPDGVADATFLARAAALGKHPDHFSFLFDDDTMEPWIDRPPFVEALDALRALKIQGPPGMETFDAEQARAAFRSGQTALLIDRAERASRWNDPQAPRPAAVAALPGSDRVFDPDRKEWRTLDPPNRPSYLPHGGGWLVGVSPRARGRNLEAAHDFLRYLAGAEASGRILGDRDFPVLPTRQSQLGGGLVDPRSAPGVDGRSWGRAVAETLTAPAVLPGLRIPEADGYLADLARARVEAIVQGTDSAEALKRAARAWNERTSRLGADRQKWHYRRSLNRPITSATPPPRPAAG